MKVFFKLKKLKLFFYLRRVFINKVLKENIYLGVSEW